MKTGRTLSGFAKTLPDQDSMTLSPVLVHRQPPASASHLPPVLNRSLASVFTEGRNGFSLLRAIPSSAVSMARRPSAGILTAPLLGAGLAVGWTACTGPTLSVIVALATTQGTATQGGLLAVAYCLGLGIPFITFALAYEKLLRVKGFITRYRAMLTLFSAGLTLTVGVLMLTGIWLSWMQQLQGVITGFEVAV